MKKKHEPLTRMVGVISLSHFLLGTSQVTRQKLQVDYEPERSLFFLPVLCTVTMFRILKNLYREPAIFNQILYPDCKKCAMAACQPGQPVG